ncbi:hypothetical protein BC938DRAFT_478987 [Jimgerdemannia flammicorona]|uniref:INO80 complex subunit B-like conserved region domain-containing protein n=1 Tax=Jimgerdemannia flammicorona TaxID=994334 RepID=A0A433QLV8_9FUNG|nr:hypothetical protein BC938DRAFT_478987 [Jimgerdemannia flammicorona]
MLKELAFLLVLLLPVAIIYFARSVPTTPATSGPQTSTSKNKKKKKKPASKAAAALKPDLPSKPAPSTGNEKTDVRSDAGSHDLKSIGDSDGDSTDDDQPAASSKPRGYVAISHEDTDPASSQAAWNTATTAKKRAGGNKRGTNPAQAMHNTDFPPLSVPAPRAPAPEPAAPLNMAAAVAAAAAQRVREVDPNVDNTPKVARVLRIKPDTPEESEEDSEVEDGYCIKLLSNKSFFSPCRIPPPPAPVRTSSTSTSSAALTKKQRQNQLRTQRKKEEKAAADEAQAARLAQHKRELESVRIKEFYTKGTGKAPVVESQWKKAQGSSKQPQATAMIDENGALIWD